MGHKPLTDCVHLRDDADPVEQSNTAALGWEHQPWRDNKSKVNHIRVIPITTSLRREVIWANETRWASRHGPFLLSQSQLPA